jgi:hypothetical protein
VDYSQFDDLARAFAAGSAPRRNALRGLTGAALILLGWHSLEETAAHDTLKKCKKFKDKQKKKACIKKARKHSAEHLSEGSTSSGRSDPCAGVTCKAVPNGTSECQNGACVVASCQTDFTQCGTACVDMQADPQHCGKCGVACPGDDPNRCINGQCLQTFESFGTRLYTAPAQGTLQVEVIGAHGGAGGRASDAGPFGGEGGVGGSGGKVTANFAVAAREVLQIRVGEAGSDALGRQGGRGGVNGGGNGEDGQNGAGGGGGGGGASDVRRGDFQDSERVVMAGGGGGGGGGNTDSGSGSGGRGGTGGDTAAGGTLGSGASANGVKGQDGSGFGPDAEIVTGAQVGRVGNGRVTITFTPT